MSRQRVDIARLLAEKTPTAAQPDTKKRSAETEAIGRARAQRTRTSPRPAETVTAGPKWRQCEPKTFYVWPDSVDELQALARRLQRQRPSGKGERITMATLVRVAIAVLLEHSDQLAGIDEDELLTSYRKAIAKRSRGAPPRNF